MKLRNIHLATLLSIAFTVLPSLVAAAQSLRDWRRLASEMVDKEIVAAGVKNERVVKAMRDTPRHEFVPVERARARLSRHGAADRQQPDHLAAVHRRLHDRGHRSAADDKVLEIGTGSGYQAAVLSPLVKDVYTIEIVEQLSKRATRTLKQLQLRKRPHARRRRLQGLARGRAVRQDHRHLLAGRSAAAAGRSAPRRRPDGRPRRRALSADALPDAQDRWQTKKRSLARDALRADDRRSRVATQSETRPGQSANLSTAASKKATKTATANDEPTGWHYQRQLTAQIRFQRARRQTLRHISKTTTPAAAATHCKDLPSMAARFRRSNCTTGSAARTSARRQAGRPAAHHRHLLRRPPGNRRRRIRRPIRRHIRLARRNRPYSRAAKSPRSHHPHRPARCGRRTLARRPAPRRQRQIIEPPGIDLVVGAISIGTVLARISAKSPHSASS